MKSRWKIAALLVALILAAMVAGAFIGAHLERKKHRRRSQPAAWNVEAMKAIERQVELTPEQRARVQQIIDAGVVDLQRVRKETIASADAVVERMIGQIRPELTPGQQPMFDELVSKRYEASLDLLNVESAGAPKK